MFPPLKFTPVNDGGSHLSRRSAFRLFPLATPETTMTRTALRTTLVLCAALTTTAALARAQSPTQALTVCGIDRSGSAKAYLRTAIDVCAHEIADAQSGSTIIVRWISDASFRTNEEVVRTTVPVGLLCSNPYDIRCRTAAYGTESSVRAVKRSALARLLTAKPAVAPRTDIAGFFQAASDAFAEDTLSRQHRMVIATDLSDTRGFKATPSFKDVTVVMVLLVGGDDPAAIVDLRNRWSRWLLNLGAKRVLFRQAEVVR